jgi:HNH endonuclease
MKRMFRVQGGSFLPSCNVRSMYASSDGCRRCGWPTDLNREGLCPLCAVEPTETGTTNWRSTLSAQRVGWWIERWEALRPLRAQLGLPSVARPDSATATVEEWGEVLGAAGSFECACGRLTSVEEGIRVRAEALGDVDLPQGDTRWWSLLTVLMDEHGYRPAVVQKFLEWSYEDARHVLDQGAAVGLLRRVSETEYAPVGARCATCMAEARVRSTEEPWNIRAVPPRLRFQVLRRDGFRCTYCGRSEKDGAVLHVDHVVPYAAGGATEESNLVTACDRCNLGKSAIEIL